MNFIYGFILGVMVMIAFIMIRAKPTFIAIQESNDTQPQTSTNPSWNTVQLITYRSFDRESESEPMRPDAKWIRIVGF